MLEHDEIPSKHMVLCVCAVNEGEERDQIEEEVKVGEEEKGANSVMKAKAKSPVNPSVSLVLSDGWYTVRALLDNDLCELVGKGKLVVGMKLSIFGAQLENCAEPLHPLEAVNPMGSSFSSSSSSSSSSSRQKAPPTLKLFCNGTRPALWHTKLGLQRRPFFAVSLAGLKPEGGTPPCSSVMVLRQYPMMYMETTTRGGEHDKGKEEGGSVVRVHRNQAAEDQEAFRFPLI